MKPGQFFLFLMIYDAEFKILVTSISVFVSKIILRADWPKSAHTHRSQTLRRQNTHAETDSSGDHKANTRIQEAARRSSPM